MSNPIDDLELSEFISKLVSNFHSRKLEDVRKKLKLKTLLKKKNPYLFRTKGVLLAQDLVKMMLDAHISSAEETIFGGLLEQLAQWVCEKSYGGRKSSCEGLDLEFTDGDKYYLVSIKSGPNWGNSSQINKLKAEFIKAKKILRTNTMKNIEYICVNGCCYGKDAFSDKGDYYKYCGQDFWRLISGSGDFYLRFINPLGLKTKETDKNFDEAYSALVNTFTKELIKDFCDDDGSINWEKLLEYNSGAKD